MKIQILSDLHLEFRNFPIDFSKADLVIFAGDVNIGEKGIQWIMEKIPNIPIIYVLGNHEYYGKTYPKLIRTLKEQTQESNISILENESMQIGGITFHGCTLWTDFELFGNPQADGYFCQQSISDYKKIRREPSYAKIRSVDVSAIHKKSVHWLSRTFENRGRGQQIVITHHAPGIRSLPDNWQQDPVNAAYASHLDTLVEQLSPDLWIHGHIHRSSDYHIRRTRVLCNPKGYPDGMNSAFDPDLIVEI